MVIFDSRCCSHGLRLVLLQLGFLCMLLGLLYDLNEVSLYLTRRVNATLHPGMSSNIGN